MSVLYALEQIRNPALDWFMAAVTHLGGEVIFMVAALAIYWCWDKHRGYYMLIVGFLGTVGSQFLKLVFRIPRPWVQDPSFTIVEAARAEATGYSFPSGHSQNVVTVFGCLARSTKNRAFRVVCVVLIALVAFSRMYLGVHTPLDVGVALALGVVLVLALYPLVESSRQNPSRMYWLLAGMLVISAAYTAYTMLGPFPRNVDTINLREGRDNGWKLTGAVAGMLLSYHLDRKYIRFSTQAPILGQVLKTVLGLGLLLALQSGLKAPLLALFGGSAAAHGLRYFLMVMFAAAVWPLTFPWFARCGRKQGATVPDSGN